MCGGLHGEPFAINMCNVYDMVPRAWRIEVLSSIFDSKFNSIFKEVGSKNIVQIVN